MKKILYSALLAYGLFFMGCNNNENDSSITVDNTADLTQTVYADNTSGKSGVSITTAGAWSSEIRYSLAKSEPSVSGWLFIDPDHGDGAGNYTINITLNANYTGERRTATITIICGSDKITIGITQEGTTQSGDVPEEPEIPLPDENILPLIPDQGFRQFLSERYAINNLLTYKAAGQIQDMDIINIGNIKSIKGIEYFSGLQRLMISQTGINAIELSKLSELEVLACFDNYQLVQFSVNNLQKLKSLECANTSVTSLGMSKLSQLEYLNCSNNQNLSKLDFSNSSQSTMSGNEFPSLKIIACSGTGPTEIDVTGLPALEELNCAYNSALIKLSVSGLSTLTRLSCENTALASLDLTGLSALELLYCNDTHLQEIDISNCTQLKGLMANSNNLLKTVYVWWYGGIEKRPAALWSHFEVPNGVEVLMHGEHEDILPKIPDAVFRKYLSDHFSIGGILTAANARAIETIDVEGSKNIHSLEGLSYFPNVQWLWCTGTGISELDVRGLPKLKSLLCGNTAISSINLSGQSGLDVLGCSHTKITSIDESKLANALTLNISGTGITQINTSGMVRLKWLYCNDTDISSLNIGNLSNLRELECKNTLITSLNVSDFTYLERLYCNENPSLTSLTLGNKPELLYLYCNNTSIVSLELSNVPKLEWFDCSNTLLTSININNQQTLKSIRCTGTSTLRQISLSNTRVIELWCYDNPVLESVVLNNMGRFTDFRCDNSGIKTLSMNNLSAFGIEYGGVLEIKKTPALETISLGNMPGLETINFANMPNLSTLALSGLTNLKFLGCSQTKITELDISESTSMTQLDLVPNPLLETVYVWWNGGKAARPAQFFLFRVPEATNMVEK